MDIEHGVPSDVIMKDLLDVLSVFKKYNVRAFLSYGAVLGAVREKDFIKWDDDIDLDVIDKIDLKTRKEIGGTLGDLGFRTQPICFNVFNRMEMVAMGDRQETRYDGDGETGIIVCERNFKFSIFFYKKEGNEYVCTPKLGGMKLISNLARFYDIPDRVKLHGETFITPGPLKEYLTYVYGDWKTPKKNFHAPQYNARHE
jgi:lipopolysaccharide cholinephosphotransferase